MRVPVQNENGKKDDSDSHMRSTLNQHGNVDVNITST